MIIFAISMKAMYRISLFLLFLFSSVICQGQKLIKMAENDSALIITQDSRVNELIKRQTQENLEKQSMPGYRIQIYFGGNRQKASEIKLDFANQFPDISTYLTYQQPNYKVRVGDYKSRFDAMKTLKLLEGKYPTTFVVPDDVKLPPLK